MPLPWSRSPIFRTCFTAGISQWVSFNPTLPPFPIHPSHSTQNDLFEHEPDILLLYLKPLMASHFSSENTPKQNSLACLHLILCSSFLKRLQSHCPYLRNVRGVAPASFYLGSLFPLQGMLLANQHQILILRISRHLTKQRSLSRGAFLSLTRYPSPD